MTDPDKWTIFLSILRGVPDRTKALETAGLSKGDLAAKLIEDTDFATEYRSAYADGLDALEDIAVRRAVFGVQEEVFYQGALVGWKTVYSDTLLMFLLKGNKPKYRGEGERGTQLSPEDRTQLKSIFDEISQKDAPAHEVFPQDGSPTAPRRPVLPIKLGQSEIAAAPLPEIVVRATMPPEEYMAMDLPSMETAPPTKEEEFKEGPVRDFIPPTSPKRSAKVARKPKK